MSHATYLDEIEPSDDEIEAMEWDMDNADEDEYPEAESLSLVYFEMI